MSHVTQLSRSHIKFLTSACVAVADSCTQLYLQKPSYYEATYLLLLPCAHSLLYSQFQKSCSPEAEFLIGLDELDAGFQVNRDIVNYYLSLCLLQRCHQQFSLSNALKKTCNNTTISSEVFDSYALELE